MSSRDIANLKNGLVAAWIPSLGSTGYRLVDRVGSNHGVLTNMDAGSDWVMSGNGLALDFDGSNDYVDIDKNSKFVSSGDKTLCGWLKTTVSSGDTENCILGSAISSGSRANFGVTINFLEPNKLNYWQNAQGRLLSSNTSVNTGDWLHWAITRQGNLSTIFINGIEDNSATSLTAPQTDLTGYETAIGRFGGFNGYYTPMQVDDIRIYSRALSATEVSLLSKERGIGFKTSSRTSSVFAKRYAYKPPKDKTYAAITRSQSDYDSLREGLVLAICPSVSGATGYRAVDVSGRGNHGTLTNMDAASDWVASNGMALDFDGSDDYVNIPASYYGTGTISFWVKTTTEIGAALAFGTSASSSNLMYVAIGQNISGTLTNELITVATISGTARIEGYTTATRTELLDGNWHHVAVVQETANASYKIYLDGNLKTTTVGDATLTTFGIGSSGGDVIQFGSRRFQAAQGVYYTGQADDIRLYSRPLTPPEIRQLASRRAIGLQPRPKQFTYYQFPSGSKRRRLLTGMP
jgi:hypothetical protein